MQIAREVRIHSNSVLITKELKEIIREVRIYSSSVLITRGVTARKMMQCSISLIAKEMAEAVREMVQHSTVTKVKDVIREVTDAVRVICYSTSVLIAEEVKENDILSCEFCQENR